MNQVATSKLRNNLRWAEKRLAKNGRISYEVVMTLPELDQAYEEFLAVEASGWKSRRGGKRAIKLHPDQTAFFRDLAYRYGSAGDCHIHLLKLDGQTLAASFSIHIGNVVYSLKSGYDEQHSKGAPGQILRKYEIEYYSADPSIHWLDLFSNFSWQHQWRPVQREVFNVYFFNRTITGKLFYGLMRSRQIIKR